MVVDKTEKAGMDCSEALRGLSLLNDADPIATLEASCKLSLDAENRRGGAHGSSHSFVTPLTDVVINSRDLLACRREHEHSSAQSSR